jgi:Fe2+ transport system protein FeoA
VLPLPKNGPKADRNVCPAAPDINLKGACCFVGAQAFRIDFENASQYQYFAPMIQQLVPLTLLVSGQTARIDQVVGGPDQVHRLEELGLRGGATIEMLQPGSPCIIRLGTHKLCFRADELTRVLVVPAR